MKTFLTLALLSSVAAAPAMAESFTHEGVSYQYNVTPQGSYQLITGTNMSTGEAFRLRVKDGRVSGDYAGALVKFRAPSSDVAAKSGGASVFAAK